LLRVTSAALAGNEPQGSLQTCKTKSRLVVENDNHKNKRIVALDSHAHGKVACNLQDVSKENANQEVQMKTLMLVSLL
jgi:hypothetical protein